MYYLRRINETKWEGRPNLDAVSISDLSTDDNDISVWEVSDKDKDLNTIALSLAMTKNRIKDMVVVILESENLKKLGLHMNPKPGDSKFVEMNNCHNNIKVPTFWELGFLSEYIHDLVSNEQYVYFAEDELKAFLYDVAKSGKLGIGILKDKENKHLKGALIEKCQELKDKEFIRTLEAL